ncbi:reducing polyketide synthase [Westerdykella ornata]|uniref:Reducing polyketide synthase n=1 Tax=Westerdykella ornata TaxID=318751 RepID=A0A6A6JF41_WESOR|nr:reducing polyketide synthase [Westerdykella ornata]KAF2273799.1 reducing polyketide synthase [Westerdykella ornata]
MPSTNNPAHVPIAIVGLACRFPGEATSPSKFWDLLKNGRDAYSPTTDRYNADAFYHPKASSRQNVLATKGGHFLKQDPYAFDAAFFNITAAEAISFDPKQRIAMEVVYEALENAGKTLQKVAGTQTACYIGSSMSDYRDAVVRDFGHSPKYHILGTCEEMISNRVSHFLDIHGPSATIHTACSSSLVATHLGCQSLQSAESEMAIVGGVGMIISPDGNMHLNNLGFLNPEGHSRAFDADAGGYGRGEGCGILILKRLDRAVQDGDSIRAVIRATGVNSDGWTQGVTMPSSEAQASLIKYVYESHGLEYESTQYVEAHGTGTKAGDPAEVGAIHRTIGQSTTKSRKLFIGSVKPNIGHLEAAAGVAGIIKCVLAMEHGLIPPNIYFSKPNPAIPLDEWNMIVPTKLTPWPVTRGPRRASVSGFGMGGTNGHVVLESYSPESNKLLNGISNGVTNGATNGTVNGSAEKDINGKARLNGTNGMIKSTFSAAVRDYVHITANSGKRLFVISSHDQAGFKRVGSTLSEHLHSLGPTASTPDYLARLAHTLAVARSGLSWKAVISAESSAELQEKLSAGSWENARRAGSNIPRIGFVFTGQGAQWSRMGVELLERPGFRESIARSSEILRTFGCDWDPIEELMKGKDQSRLGVPEISQPICSVLQIALVDELKTWGIVPSKVVGHSSGEIAAAYSIGALSHHDALAVAYFRGVASSGLKHLKGGMMAVGSSPEDAQRLIKQAKLGPGAVSVACVNSPSSVTISGDVAALEELRVFVEEQGVFARRLKVDVAYHSSHMNSAVAKYSASISEIEPQQSTAKHPVMVSSVTNQEVDAELLGPYYWIRNLISPVLFSDAVKEMVSPSEGDGRNEVDLLIEVGPHSALGGPIEQILAYHGIKNVGYASVLTRGENGLDCALKLATELILQGVPLDVQRVNGDSGCRLLTHLPPYPWNHSKTFRADSRIHRELISQKFPTRSLIGAKLPAMSETEHEWRTFIRLSEEPWLRGHTVGSTVLFPGAGIVSIVLEAVQQLVDAGKRACSFRLRDVSLFAAMALPEDQATEVIIHMRPHLIATSGTTPASWWEFTVSSCVGTDQLRDNARGLITVDYHENRSQQMIDESTMITTAQVEDYHRIQQECTDTCSKEQFYQHMTKASWRYGELFQGVENCHIGYGKTTFDIRLVDVGETFSRGQLDRPFLINAASLDAIFQCWLGATYNNGAFEFDKPFVPTSIGELEISADIPADADYVMPGLCRAERYGFNELSADIAIFDNELSTTVLSVKDFRTSELDVESGKVEGDGAEIDPADITSEVTWNYALPLLHADELKKVLNTASANSRLEKLIFMLLHENPAASVVELISDTDKRDNAVMSKIPEEVISPSRVCYAVEKSEDNKDESSLLIVDANDQSSPVKKSAADVLIVTSEVEDPARLEDLVNQLAKPNATVVIATSNEVAAKALIGMGFYQVSSPDGVGSVSIYMNRRGRSEGVTNGSLKDNILIIEPSTASSTAQEFSSTLQNTLRNHGYPISPASWDNAISAEDVNGKICVSLLEFEQPLLDNLSDRDFEKVRTMVLNSDRVLWITSGDNPAFGMVEGFARCIMSEIAGKRFQLLHLSEATGLQHGPVLASRILGSDSNDNEYRESGGLLQVARIWKSYQQNENIRYHLEDSTRLETLADRQEPLRLTIGKPGLLDTLKFVPDERIVPALGDDEVEVQVKATGLNFRDVMASMGLIPVTWLGQEASGVVVRTGRNVTNVKQGDRVNTIHVGTHATRIRVNYRGLARIPEGMSFEEAAAIPVVHTTAYYAFVRVAKLRAGQSVLIHAAAGGVGQAAIQLAKHLGLVIFVTVGTEEKRRLITEEYGIPDGHIFYSRDASFVKGILRVTNGRGVDCILNSLSGELLRASWNCLATFGTFVEIGLRDITNNMRLDMRPFGKSTSFTFINNHTLFEQDPETFYEAFHAALKPVEQGHLRAPSPVVAYPVDQIGEAFRIMQQGKHRGKLVLSFEGYAKAPVLHRAKDSLKLDPEATYLFVGGLGGLGRSLAKEFVACGARNIAFLSRSGDSTPQAKAIIDELTSRTPGVRIKAYRGDISDNASFSKVMAQCEQDLPPVKGVIQMAMVLRDIVFEKMSYSEWTIPVQPKVQGTWNLHKYFDQSRPLDFMIICSSSSGIYGYPSQAQYAAGNTYQDALARYRRSQGLKAISVNLGIMRDVGILAETGTSGNIKLWEEVLGIREPVFHALMKSLITQEQKRSPETYPVQVCTGLGTADILVTHGLARPDYFNDPRFGPLAVTSVDVSASAEANGSAVSLAARLSKTSSKEQATEIITEALVEKTADILQMPASEVDPSRPLYRYGVDSLVALEVRNWITREMKANMALLEILAAVPIESFASKIAEKSKLVMVE